MIEVENILSLILILGVVAVWISFLRNLFSGVFGLDIIAGVALVSTLIAEQYLAGVVVLIMYVGGQFLEEYAMQRSKKELSLLLERNPNQAHKKVGDTFVDVSINDIKPGDTVLVKSQEILTVDGIVESGETTIDESVLTGESEPVLKSVQSLVFAGTENLSNPITLKVLKFPNQTKFNEIVELVKNSQNNKARIVRLADKYSLYFTSVTFLLAGLTWFFTGDFVRFIAVLVVATPCPLLIATPVAIMSGMSAAYKKGVIVKTGGVLEMLAKAKFFVFDKTGTITLGTPKVSQIIPSEGVTQNEVLTIATSLEQFSTHVLGKAIMKFSHDQGNTVFFMPANFHEDFGLGVSGEVNGKKYFLGKKYYLESMGLEFPRMLNAASEAALQKGQITIYLSDAKKVIGLILFEDELRPDSKSIFSRFVLDGRVSLSILTGDSEAKAKQVGELLGVADVIAETNPQGKMEFVKEKQREGVVVMVGDGVNDAPALSQADVGVAITNQDRTASSQVADVVVVSNSITSIYDVYNISKKTTYLAKQGIFIGMTASVVAMIFAGFGFIAPLHGALLQEAIDIVVILNALRLKVYFDIVKLR